MDVVYVNGISSTSEITKSSSTQRIEEVPPSLDLVFFPPP